MPAQALPSPITNTITTAFESELFSIANNNTRSKRAANRSKSNPSRRVRFAPTAKLVEIQHLDDMTDEQIDNTYYSEKDYAAIMEGVTTTIKANLHKKEIDTKNQTMRGIEHCRTKRILDKYKSDMKRHISLIMQAQSAGLSPKDISHLSSKFTVTSARHALDIAAKDAIEASRK